MCQTNWGHKNKNYLQIRNNNNNNVYTIKICGMDKLYNKTIYRYIKGSL